MDWQTWVDGGRTTPLGEERIWFRVEGSGPTLLFAHGFPTSSHDYAPVIEQLAKTCRCVSFDFLGFGASSKPRRAYSYALQHEVLAKVAIAANITRAVLIVHDYAVTLGQDALAGTPRAPFALDGVIFLNGAIDPAHYRPRPIQRLFASRMGAVLGVPLLNRRTVLGALRAVFVRKEHLPEDDAWEAITSNNGLAILPRLLHYIAERRGRREALVAALGSPAAPKAFIWGEDDPVSGKHVFDAVRHLVKGATICELRGVGHYPQLEASGEVAAFIDRTVAMWIKGVQGATDRGPWAAGEVT